MITGYFEIDSHPLEGFAPLEVDTLLHVFAVMQRGFNADITQDIQFTDSRIWGKFLVRTIDFATWCEVREFIKLNIIGRHVKVSLVGGWIGNEKLDHEGAEILLTWNPMPKPKTNRRKLGVAQRIMGSFLKRHVTTAVGDIYPDELDDELWEDDWDE